MRRDPRAGRHLGQIGKRMGDRTEMQILWGDEDLTYDRTGQQDQNIIDRIETNISSAVPARTDRGTY